MIGFGDLPRLPAIGGILDQPCPLCSPFRKKKKLRCLRVWRPEPDWLTFHCVHCEVHGYTFKDGVSRDIDWATQEKMRLERQRHEDEQRTERERYAANVYGHGFAGHPMIEAYFEGRGLKIPDAARKQLRFHPACRFQEGVFGAILMPFRHYETYHFTGVHRIAVDDQGQAIRVAGRKLKKSLGSVSGSAMMWQRITDRLTICEGLETAFGVIMAGINEGSPVWALSGKSFLEQFGPGGSDEPVKQLIIAADADKAGLGAANRCADHWEGTAMVNIIWPDEPGTDFASPYERTS